MPVVSVGPLSESRYSTAARCARDRMADSSRVTETAARPTRDRVPKLQPSGSASPDAQELFELNLYGGAPEKRYRRLRPDLEKIEWDRLSPRGISKSELLAARRGWTDAALQEYASAAAHALMLRALVRARVPLDLSAVASRFPLDELAHAEMCARVAGRFGGGTPLRYDRERVFPLPSTRGVSPEIEAAHLVIWNCVSETWAHEMLRLTWASERNKVLKLVRGRLARDEAGHARFGWLFLDWLEPGLEEADWRKLREPCARVVAVLEHSLAHLAKLPDDRFGPLTPMSLGKRSYVALATLALEQRVRAPLRDRGLIS